MSSINDAFIAQETRDREDARLYNKMLPGEIVHADYAAIEQRLLDAAKLDASVFASKYSLKLDENFFDSGYYRKLYSGEESLTGRTYNHKPEFQGFSLTKTKTPTMPDTTHTNQVEVMWRNERHRAECALNSHLSSPPRSTDRDYNTNIKAHVARTKQLRNELKRADLHVQELKVRTEISINTANINSFMRSARSLKAEHAKIQKQVAKIEAEFGTPK